LLVTGL
jgi:Ca2+ transporting ATPase